MSPEYVYAVGRRKTAIARVRITPGAGKFAVNGKTMEEFFPREILRIRIQSPLKVTENSEKLDIDVVTEGGGVASQADAVSHGISRALVKMDSNLRPTLRKADLLTRDPRAKERKKYGLKRARKAKQYTKR